MSDDKPTYSFLLPAFNAQSTLRRALDSVLAQGDELSWELIAVDDGSTDETRAIFEEYAAHDDRVRVFAQENRGAGAARELAQSEARGDYFIQMDADDALDPRYLDEMHRFITRNSEANFFSCNGYFVTYDNGGKMSVGRKYVSGPVFDSEVSLSLSDILREPVILGGGSVIARELVDSSGGFRAGYRADDFDFWIRAFLHGAVHRFLPKALYFYSRGVPGQLNENQIESFRSFVESIDNALKTPGLSMAQREMLHKGRQHYAKRLDPAYYEMSGVNEQLASQSEAFYAFLTAHFSQGTARKLFKVAHALKKPFDPLRIALARRKEQSKTHGDE